ncbi:MAG: hypothetical protein EA403_13400 [Spirochaetaceae bacterium]|nr:MAG: hypothetical protein EA403_13400 [Spirochaetaceae bacterium]
MTTTRSDRSCHPGHLRRVWGHARWRQALSTLILVTMALAGCRTFFPAPADDDDSAAVATIAPDPARVPDPVPDALAGLPGREVEFLRRFARAAESGDWQWVLDRAEVTHAEELMGRLGMDEESYLSFLLRLGESFQTRARRDDAEPGYFSPYDTVRVAFIGHERSELSTTVRGLLYNRSDRTIDFTLTLLSQLQDMKLTGAFY